MPTDLLFAYGTLMRGFPRHAALGPAAALLGAGRVRGRLLDLGTYPGMVPDAVGTVHGEVYRVAGADRWRALDSTEGPQYHRQEATVSMADGREVTAFVYWYRGPLDRGVPIPGGDYRAHGPARSIHGSSRP